MEILKGLVFPQWRRRTIAIIGSTLIVYPGILDKISTIIYFLNFNLILESSSLLPESYDLASAEIFEHPPVYNRLIIKIVPKLSDNSHNNNNIKENLNRIKSIDCLNSVNANRKNSAATSLCKSNNNLNCSNLSVNAGEREIVLFLGFEESWERDLWSAWMMEVIECK